MWNRNSKYWLMGALLSALMAFAPVSAAKYIKPTDLSAETTLATGDEFIVEDVSAGTTDKVTLANIFAAAGNVGASTIVTVGALDAGSITSGFGAIDNGTSGITTGADITLDVDGVSATSGRLLMGGGGDAELYYDGTDFIADPRGVGSGDFRVLNAAEVRGDAGAAGDVDISTAELTVVDGDLLGRIDFIAPLESSGTDAILAGASIWAEADDTFAADNNTTEIVFAVGTSAAATEVMRILSTGDLSIPDGTAATSGRLLLGTGADSEMYFNGTDMVIDYDTQNAGTTDFRIQENTTDQLVILTGGAATFTSTVTTTADITGGNCAATGDTATDDNANMGYTAAEGLILTGQGSTNDVTIKNDADADVIVIPTGTTTPTIADDTTLTTGTITLADGGTVTQITNRSTGVTLNTHSGQITTDNTSLAAGAEATFTVTNSVVTALDAIIVSISDSPDADSDLLVGVTDIGAGTFDITYSNVSGNADTGAVVINFVVLRGASS